MTRLKQALEAQQGVHGVEVNHAAGSVTVKYDAQIYGETGIFGLLEDLDALVGTMLDAPHLEEAPTEGNGHSKAAVTLAGALDDLDKHVAGLTGHTVNLRTLFPLGLAGLGVWRIMENGLMAEMVPGWLLVWLAFDAFVKLHPPAMPARATETSG
jgi:copper chaperone CopZ